MKVISRKEARAQGLKRYFTGKPCKHGHVAERFSSGRGCLECKKAYRQTEESKAYKKAYQQTEKSKATQKAYRQSEEAKAHRRAYQQTEKSKATQKAYRQSEKRKATQKAYRQSEAGVKSKLKKQLGFEPSEEFVKQVHAVRKIKRLTKSLKQKQKQ